MAFVRYFTTIGQQYLLYGHHKLVLKSILHPTNVPLKDIYLYFWKRYLIISKGHPTRLATFFHARSPQTFSHQGRLLLLKNSWWVNFTLPSIGITEQAIGMYVISNVYMGHIKTTHRQIWLLGRRLVTSTLWPIHTYVLFVLCFIYTLCFVLFFLLYLVPFFSVRSTNFVGMG